MSNQNKHKENNIEQKFPQNDYACDVCEQNQTSGSIFDWAMIIFVLVFVEKEIFCLIARLLFEEVNTFRFITSIVIHSVTFKEFLRFFTLFNLCTEFSILIQFMYTVQNFFSDKT